MVAVEGHQRQGKGMNSGEKKKPASQGNTDPRLSSALSSPGLLLRFNTALKQPLSVGLCFGWLPDLLLGFHRSWSGAFQSQPLLIPTPRTPCARPHRWVPPTLLSPSVCLSPASDKSYCHPLHPHLPPFCSGAANVAPVCFHLLNFKARCRGAPGG